MGLQHWWRTEVVVQVNIIVLWVYDRQFQQWNLRSIGHNLYKIVGIMRHSKGKWMFRRCFANAVQAYSKPHEIWIFDLDFLWYYENRTIHPIYLLILFSVLPLAFTGCYEGYGKIYWYQMTTKYQPCPYLLSRVVDKLSACIYTGLVGIESFNRIKHQTSFKCRALSGFIKNDITINDWKQGPIFLA